jgi:outer membrane protein OmpA-like peptidoglycan-associated protein
MTMRPVHLLLTLCLLLPLQVAVAASSEHEDAVARLQADLRALETDPSLADLGALARLKARQAVAATVDARRRDREHSVFVAGLRIAAARAAAEAELLQQQSAQLDNERDQIMIEASRREAEQARREAERLRLRALAREETAEREAVQREAAQTMALESAAAETAQARKLAEARAHEAELARREAELAASIAADDITDATPPPHRREGGQDIYTLAGNAFGSGSASLTAEAQASLRALAAALAGNERRISVEGHTDSQGEDEANLRLSVQRAEAVRRTLEDGGLSPSLLSAGGHGEARPVADNQTAGGRAANRRVEIIVK